MTSIGIIVQNYALHSWYVVNTPCRCYCRNTSHANMVNETAAATCTGTNSDELAEEAAQNKKQNEDEAPREKGETKAQRHLSREISITLVCKTYRNR